jgi:uncharacterized protein YegL
MAALMLIALASPFYSAEDPDSGNKFNIVLVTDASGSMNNTDGSGLRYEAIGRFIGILANDGNMLGSVVFSDEVKSGGELREVQSKADREYILQNIKNVGVGGYTNIGAALETAIDMLDRGKNDSLPSIILFLTDGKSELGSDDALKRSLEQKADAIESARQKGYTIHTICLNADGNADPAELRQIASAAGGYFEEIKTANDLEKVFDTFYEIIYKGSTIEPGDERQIPDGGVLEVPFSVDRLGTAEINIILKGNVREYRLVDPERKEYGYNDLQGMAFETENSVIIKIVNPVGGEWRLFAEGIPRSNVTIDFIYNSNISMGFSAEPESDSYKVGDQISAAAFLAENGVPIEASKYDGYSAELIVKDSSGGESAYPMQIGGNGFIYAYTLDAYGTFELSARIYGRGYEERGGSFFANVGNTPPKANQDLERHVNLWPFKDNSAVIDLSPAASDDEDAVLSYGVISSAFNPDEYSIDGSRLLIKSYSLSKGSFEISATDSQGASCSFNVLITTTNIGLWASVGLGALILTAAGVLVLLAYLASRKRFRGVISIVMFDDESGAYEMRTKRPSRGAIALSSFGFGRNSTKIDMKKCKFHATGKKFIRFTSPKPLYTPRGLKKEYQIEGNGIDEATISASREASSGFRVTFTSELPERAGRGYGGGRSYKDRRRR